MPLLAGLLLGAKAPLRCTLGSRWLLALACSFGAVAHGAEPLQYVQSFATDQPAPVVTALPTALAIDFAERTEAEDRAEFADATSTASDGFEPEGNFDAAPDFDEAAEDGLSWPRWSSWEWLPEDLLWDVPLANQREPRMYGKLLTLEVNDWSTIDTAIGAEFGGIRWNDTRYFDAVQLDFFGVVFTRIFRNEFVAAADYRFGFPLTFAVGPWQAKAGYEHTSTHLLDEFIERTSQPRIEYARDEIVLGLSRFFADDWRLYGQAAFAVYRNIDWEKDGYTRFDWGAEWYGRKHHTRWGEPFAAFDMDLREETEFEPNVTVQLGWRMPNRQDSRAVRIAAEYYHGKSPYGQFFRNEEEWAAVTFAYDW